MDFSLFCRGGDLRELHGLRYAKYPEHHKNTTFLRDGPLINQNSRTRSIDLNHQGARLTN
jgi:hypothetical protein